MDALLLKNGRILRNASSESLKKEMKKGAVWINLKEDEPEPLHEFGINSAILRTLKRSGLPTYHDLNGTLCILLLRLAPEDASQAERLYAFTRKGLLATINCQKEMESFAGGKMGAGAESALCSLILSVTESNEQVMEGLEERLELIEDRLIRKREMRIREVLSFKRKILFVNKAFWHERDIITFLRHCGALELGSGEMMQLDEAHNSLLYCVDLNNTFREILTDSLDVYHTIVSNGINSAIKRLTIVTVVLAIIATVTSIPNTIATVFGIPYFPIKPDSLLGSVFGFEIFPWDLILILLILGSVVPSLLLYWWWNRVQHDGGNGELTSEKDF